MDTQEGIHTRSTAYNQPSEGGHEFDRRIGCVGFANCRRIRTNLRNNADIMFTRSVD